MTFRTFCVFALGCAALVGACGSMRQPEGSERSSELLSGGAAPASTLLSYYGGPVISNVKVIQVNWNANVDPTIASGMGGFYSAFTKSEAVRWLDNAFHTTINANAGSHSGQAGTNQHIGTGSFAGAYTLTQTQTTVTDSFVQQVLSASISNSTLPAPDANTVYMIHFPPGASISDAFGNQTCVAICDYHSTMTVGGQAVKYGVLPDMTSCNGNGACATNPSSFDNTTMYASRGLIGAITDPNVGLETTQTDSFDWDYPGAWAGGDGEVDDICGTPGKIRARKPDGSHYVVLEEFDPQSSRCIVGTPAGDIDGDGRSDYALTGGSGWNTIPVAFAYSSLIGTFDVTNTVVSNFPSTASAPGVKAVPGDFDGDSRSEIALTGGAGWNTIPVAFSNGDGSFRVTNSSVSDFPGDATATGAQAVSGDFDGDGLSDIALTGGQGWGIVPVAFSNGDGSFHVTEQTLFNFPGWAASSGAKAVAGDFDGDGRSDIALTGVTGWNTVPVAFSNGDGTFRVTNVQVANFPTWATQAGATPIAGDFNGDGLSDIALTGGQGWSTIPVAFSNGDGSFRVTNTGVTGFPGDTAGASNKAVSGQFSADGLSDICIARGNDFYCAFSNGDGSFVYTGYYTQSSFPQWAGAAGVQSVGAY
jgi:hypothetical protein